MTLSTGGYVLWAGIIIPAGTLGFLSIITAGMDDFWMLFACALPVYFVSFILTAIVRTAAGFVTFHSGKNALFKLIAIGMRALIFAGFVASLVTGLLTGGQPLVTTIEGTQYINIHVLTVYMIVNIILFCIVVLLNNLGRLK